MKATLAIYLSLNLSLLIFSASSTHTAIATTITMARTTIIPVTSAKKNPTPTTTTIVTTSSLPITSKIANTTTVLPLQFQLLVTAADAQATRTYLVLKKSVSVMDSPSLEEKRKRICVSSHRWGCAYSLQNKDFLSLLAL